MRKGAAANDAEAWRRRLIRKLTAMGLQVRRQNAADQCKSWVGSNPPLRSTSCGAADGGLQCALRWCQYGCALHWTRHRRPGEIRTRPSHSHVLELQKTAPAVQAHLEMPRRPPAD